MVYRNLRLYRVLGLFVWSVLGLSVLWPETRAAQEVGAKGRPVVQLKEAFPNLRFDRLVDLQDPGDGSGRLFAVEQAGRIRVFKNKSDAETATVFLDIQKKVRTVHTEEGLLGLAFHPQFKKNGRFFVNYSASKPRRSIISQFEVNPLGASRALLESEKVILEVLQPYGNHNGGALVFGPDGYLYIGWGDGGYANDPHGNGQNKQTLLGAMLRIDVDKMKGNRPYAIPETNPFVSDEKARGEIFLYGLRNPWRYSFDRSTGELWIADVGQDAYEEINRIPGGKGGLNLGWNQMEGLHCFKPAEACNKSELHLPVIEYDHQEGQSVTGGYVYRGERLKSLKGQYLYADFVSGKIWAFDSASEKATPRLLMKVPRMISSFAQDQAGEVYLLDYTGQVLTLEIR